MKTSFSFNKTYLIWLNFKDKLKFFILSKISDTIVAEDILQDVFIKIHSKIDTLKDETKLKAWIYQITNNLIIDYYRKNKNFKLQIQYLEDNDDKNPDNELLEEALQDMMKTMDNMPAEYCEALCITEFEGLSQKEYAQKIGISYSAAKSRVQRARKLLKDMLMNCCHYQFDKYGTILNISPNKCCCCNP